MKTFSREKLIEALEALPARHRAAFAASTSERLYPNYEAFVAEEGAGERVVLREGLDLVWSIVEGGDVDEVRVRRLMDRVDSNGPNIDDFGGFFGELAEGAASAVYYTLECCLTGAPQSAVASADGTVGSIGSYLVGAAGMGGHGSFLPKAEREADPRAEGDHTERWINSSPLMLAELWAQEEDLAALRGAPTLTPELLRTLRERSQKGGIQPFERRLVKREAIPENPRPIRAPYECDECEGCGRGDDGGTCMRCNGTGRVRTLIHRDATGAE